MTEEQIRKPYYNDKSLAELQKEIKTVPTDGEGRAVSVHFNEMFVRSTVLKLINDILALQQQNKQLIEALTEVHAHLKQVYSKLDYQPQEELDKKWILNAIEYAGLTVAGASLQKMQGKGEER